jgi:hypothetical protein
MVSGHTEGVVSRSSMLILARAWSVLRPHSCGSALKLTQIRGRSGLPNRAHRFSVVKWIQRTPAGFPCGMPGMGLEMETAMQQAPQPGRQFMGL